MSPVHTGGAPSSAEALTGHADPTGPVKKEGQMLSLTANGEVPVLWVDGGTVAVMPCSRSIR